MAHSIRSWLTEVGLLGLNPGWVEICRRDCAHCSKLIKGLEYEVLSMVAYCALKRTLEVIR